MTFEAVGPFVDPVDYAFHGVGVVRAQAEAEAAFQHDGPTGGVATGGPETIEKLVAAVPDVGEALPVEAGGVAPIGGMQIVQVGAREADAIAHPLKGSVQDRVDDGADGEARGERDGDALDVAETVGVRTELEEGELSEAQAHGAAI